MEYGKIAEYESIFDSIQQIGFELDADLYLYTGKMQDSGHALLMEAIEQTTEMKTNALLILSTYGGNADTAYRLANFFYDSPYDGFNLLVPNLCKSAGTIVALGARKLYMGNRSELGPLDAQFSLNKDNPFFPKSALQNISAINTLKKHAFEFYEYFLFNTLRTSNAQIPFQHASDTAKDITIGLLAPVFQQLNPQDIGNDNLSLHTAIYYGNLLSELSGNVKDDTIGKLVFYYPSHQFVIGQSQAREMFKYVLDPTDEMVNLISMVSNSEFAYWFNPAIKEPFAMSLTNFVSEIKLQYKRERKNENEGNSNETSNS